MRMAISLRRGLVVAFVSLFVMSGVVVTGVGAQDPPPPTTSDVSFGASGTTTCWAYLTQESNPAPNPPLGDDIPTSQEIALGGGLTWDEETGWTGLPLDTTVQALVATGGPANQPGGARKCTFNGSNDPFTGISDTNLGDVILPASALTFSVNGGPNLGALPFAADLSHTFPTDGSSGPGLPGEDWFFYNVGIHIDGTPSETARPGTYVSTVTFNIALAP